MVKVFLKEDRRELYQRLESSVREIQQNKKVYQIALNYKKKLLLLSSCPPEKIGILIDTQDNRYNTFMGIPLLTDMDDDSIEWQLRTDEKFEIYEASR